MKAFKLGVIVLIVLALGGCFFFSSNSTASLQVVNTSGFEIFYFYISPAGSSVWGTDKLGDATIPSGTNFTFTDIAPGTYDIEARWRDNSTVIDDAFGVYLEAGKTYVWSTP